MLKVLHDRESPDDDAEKVFVHLLIIQIIPCFGYTLDISMNLQDILVFPGFFLLNHNKRQL
jgi:hypothetical protein